MTEQDHFRALEGMYAAAPINAFFKPEMTVARGSASISIALKPDFHHAAGAVHGSVYFKMLDDAAFFAASSLEQEVFVLTASFTTYLTRPVSLGTIRSEGKVVHQSRNQFIAESVVYDDQGREIGRGNGIFVKGRQRLARVTGYSAPG